MPFLTYASRVRRSERRGVQTAVPAAPMAIWRATALAFVAKAPRSAPRKRSMRLIGGASPSQSRRGLHPRLGIGQIRAREGCAGDEQAADLGRSGDVGRGGGSQAEHLGADRRGGGDGLRPDLGAIEAEDQGPGAKD